MLVRRAQAGDADAVAALYQRHSPAIFRYFSFRVNDQATAEDLTGEVFLKVVEALPRYVDRGFPFAAWLFRIAHDRVVDYHRRATLRQAETLGDYLPDDTADTEAAALRLTEDRELHQLIRHLTDEQQVVLQLRYVEGYGLEDVALIMRKNVGSVKALQHRALRHLARLLES